MKTSNCGFIIDSILHPALQQFHLPCFNSYPDSTTSIPLPHSHPHTLRTTIAGASSLACCGPTLTLPSTVIWWLLITIQTKPKVLTLAPRALQDIALVCPAALVTVVYCCVPNHPNTQWLKTIAIIYVAHAPVSDIGLDREGLSLFHRVSAGAAHLELEDSSLRWCAPMVGNLVLAGQGAEQGLKTGVPWFLSTSCLGRATAW